MKLKDEINNQEAIVYRGAYGTCSQIPIKELVVGDIIDIQQGDRVPADCILVEEMNITVDQSLYYPGQEAEEKENSRVVFNGEFYEDNHKEHPDPFLFSNTKIMTG